MRGSVVLSGGLATSPFRIGASLRRRSSNTLPDSFGVSRVLMSNNPRLHSLFEVGNMVRCAGDKRCWSRSLALPQARFAGFGSFDAWLDAFIHTLKRDTIFNVGKIGGIILLYYLAPGVLTWFTNTFGWVPRLLGHQPGHSPLTCMEARPKKGTDNFNK